MTRAGLQTARLWLRPVAPQDAVASLLNDIAVSGWLEVVPYPDAPAEFRPFQSETAKPGAALRIDPPAVCQTPTRDAFLATLPSLL